MPLHFHTSPLSTLRTPQRPQVFISDIRACANAEQEQVRVDKELAKKIVAQVKDAKLKVQAAIQGEQVRITGKKRDDLQEAMALLRTKELDMPLQFNNFRD